jgi:hypothetical protein
MADVEEKHSDRGYKANAGLPTLAADFQCSVCGSIFTTDLDREQHLEKEAHGILHDGSTTQDIAIAKHQQEINEDRVHYL